LKVTSKDDREATVKLILDYGQEHDTLFGCFMRDTGEFWWVPSYEIRLFNNWSLGRPVHENKTDNAKTDEEQAYTIRDCGIITRDTWERAIREQPNITPVALVTGLSGFLASSRRLSKLGAFDHFK